MTTTPSPSVASSSPAASAAPALSGPGTVCDSNPGRRVVINRGSVNCAQAVRIINATPGAYEAAPPTIEGWRCVRDGGYGELAMVGHNYSCTRGGDQVLAQDSSVPIANNWVDADDYFAANAEPNDGFYFTTESRKFFCAIFYTSGSARAGCHGHLPRAAPTIHQSPQYPTANTIESVDGAFGDLLNRGDPEYQLIGASARVLPYGHPLFVGGYTCVVDYSTGVTCRSFTTGHGFTVNDVRYQLF